MFYSQDSCFLNTQTLSTQRQRQRSINELPQYYQRVFSQSFSYFNQVQSKLLDHLISGDKTLVISAPTGSGKTVLLELAIIREMIKLESANNYNRNSQSSQFNYLSQTFQNLHVLYLAPLKAIVEEKCSDWQKKFSPLGVKCATLTGDTSDEGYKNIQDSAFKNMNIILATPEKFDHVIRTDNKSRGLINILQLILIDEIHILADKSRGDVLEATITRIKSLRSMTKLERPLRFVAISATCPNATDIALWLDSTNSIGITVPEELRPVKLEKIVLGYPVNKSQPSTDYRFDMTLTYKLDDLIRVHCDQKPTLVFCSTRKGVEFAAKILSAAPKTFFLSTEQRDKLYYELQRLITDNFNMTNGNVADNEGYFKNLLLKTCIASGVGFYHSGLEFSDRRLLEQLFSLSLIPVLVATSSLAMGVNLPAHLVIIRNTVQYNAGSSEEYDISMILQMIGRAGRPQFDTSARAIIMTRADKKERYETILSSQRTIESSMHKILAEQLTSEIVLKSVTRLNSAINWIESTFMFRRIISNPAYYGSDIPPGDYEGAIPFVSAWCERTVERLNDLGLITLKDMKNFDATHLARIMTKNSVSLSTFNKLTRILVEPFDLKELLEKICNCKELCADVTLRVTDKRHLNELNKKIRFPFKDRFKNNLMKINCLQSTFESLTIDWSLMQNTQNNWATYVIFE